MPPKVIDVRRYGASFGINVLYISQFAENSYFTSIMRKACFGLSRPPILTPKTNPKIKVFSRHLPAHPFFKSYVDFMEKHSICEPLQDPVGFKMGPKIDQVALSCQQM